MVAGNDGPACGTVGVPGLAGSAFTVGALNRQGVVADFSSRGPVILDGSGRTKPDVMAPGVGIISDLPDGRYAEFGGTSMAVSHVVGIAALLWSADPALKGNVDRTEQIIKETAQKVIAPDVCGSSTQNSSNVYGYGRVDALEAVRLALATP
jgi:subtilisin family serine protease